MLVGYAKVALALILDPSGGLFSAARTALSAARSSIWRKRGTRKSGLETNPENEARSALLARLWCHLIQVLEPIFEPVFHKSSHGFRPNRGAARCHRCYRTSSSTNSTGS